MTDGHMTLIAANGDELFATYSGKCDILVPTLGQTVTCRPHALVTGGTGRFAHASGTLHGTVMVISQGIGSPTPWPLTWMMEGMLSY